MLERYGHGGDLQTAAETFGIDKANFLDFSANMNPLGPPPIVEQIMIHQWREMMHYPDPVSRELVRAIACHYDIPPESILVGNGAAELIDLLVRELRPDVTGLARPSFVEYEDAVRHAGGKIYDIPLHEENLFQIQIEELEKALKVADLLFLGHPNNPTGQLLPQSIIDLIVDKRQPLILDEAFIDFVPSEDQVSRIRQAASCEDLYVIRSMTKFYTIPGVRLGFLVGDPRMIAHLQTRKTPWSVNCFAQAIGQAVLGDRDFAEKTREWLAVERPWLMNQLRLMGLRVMPSDVNFILFALDPRSKFSITQLQQMMGRKGVLLRSCAGFPGLNERFGRIAVRTRAENERLVAAWRQVLEEWH